MGAIESALTWTNAAPTVGNNVTVSVGDPDTSTVPNEQVVVLEAYGKDGNCYYIQQSNDPAGSSTGYAEVKQTTAHLCYAITTPAAGPPTAPLSGVAGSSGNVAAANSTPVYYTSF